MPIARRDFKDSLFWHLFGREENRANALELYNALRGTSHTDPSALEFNTIENFIYLGYRNDISFVIGDEMVLLEHQSTFNPNMPIRGLLYFARLYTKHIDANGLDLYSAGELQFPTPRFLVLYFGEAKQPDRKELTLSSLFSSGPGDIEVRATMLNCNEGHNQTIMGASETLRGYAHLVALVRAKRAAGLETQRAVDKSIGECIADGILAEYLKKHRAEVREMLFTMEYEERAREIHEKAIQRQAQEKGFNTGFDQGIEKGIEKGIEQGIEQERERVVEALKKAGIDPSVIAE